MITGSKSVFAGMMLSFMAAVLSLSIALPIVIRPFYYAHINGMDLPEQTGWSYEEIKQAYDEMLDFCMYGGEFSTGVMRWSEDGRQHFIDVGKLFRIDFFAFLIAVTVLAGLLVFNRNKAMPRYYGYGPFYWGSWGLLILFALLIIVASVDFSQFFTVFHHVFFPGKTNWVFDPYRDEIIRVLPEEFFRNCAIAIASSLILICVSTIIREKKVMEK